MAKKILVIYATYGSGHKSIAKYIERYFGFQNPSWEIKLIDLFDYNNSKGSLLIRKMAERLMLHHPHWWNIIYRYSNHKYTGNFSEALIRKPFKNKSLEYAIKDFNPDLTIATHFYGNDIIAEYNRRQIINSKLIAIVTDYAAHKSWLKSFDQLDYLIVGSQEEQKSLGAKGYDQTKIKPFGIPIYSNPEPLIDCQKKLAALGLDPKKLTGICFAGGSNGSTGTLPYLKAILKAKRHHNLIIVAGKNLKAKAKLAKYIQRYQVSNVRLYGFVTNALELINMSDFVITKPGGALITECMYFKKPMLLIKSSGGQENENIRFLTRNGYSKKFRSPRALARYYCKLSHDSHDLKRMQRSLECRDHQSAIKKIYDLSMDLLG